MRLKSRLYGMHVHDMYGVVAWGKLKINVTCIFRGLKIIVVVAYCNSSSLRISLKISITVSVHAPLHVHYFEF